MGAVHEVSDGSFDKISKQLDSLMEELMGQTFTRLVSSNAWEPRWNIYEDSVQYVVCVDLAGMAPEHIEVHVDRGTLRLSGFREKPELPESSATPTVHIMEIDWGRFERSFAIPSEVDATSVGATYRKGYLWVRLPKTSD